ncbi:MAG TPA: DEAD/DEAH box helicase [Egibacteraceae bacterium]|nr:DEAD/DEAH box helicase [Egibacteraceae bacterium]
MVADPALARFSAPTREWFSSSFDAPTEAQAAAWSHIHEGANVLVSAPTGSGKTLAAFLATLDRLFTTPREERGTRVLYVSPLKALAYDVDRNLRAPLAGITRAAERRNRSVAPVDVALRSGDTPADERARMARTPPDILITTPESLFLLLTARARETLADVETVILDEVHAVAGTKRGGHLALSLERLEALAGRPLQRIGLSATQRPLDEVARFLGGGVVGGDGAWTPRPVRIVEAGARKQLEVEIVVPVEDMSRLGEVLEEPPTGPAAVGEQRRSIWPAVQPRILELVLAHRSTIVFANSRRLAERLCARLNELANATRGDDEPEVVVARAHHGSIAREQRVEIESALKEGRLRCVVATSSLELGIDMGAVDLVVQVESPGSVSRGLQRIGRAGHAVGAPSVGKVFPKYRGDLVEAAVVVRRMHEAAIEETRYPRNPLDVLAQQVVAMAAMDSWDVGELVRVVRGAASFADLSRAQLDGVLDMLSGRYPSDEFAELRPRLNWDRVADRIVGRAGAQRLAVTSGGTIPDRGLYGVFVEGEGTGRRVGELDEEMVYETRPGETIVLGSTTWRVTDITRDQVLVTPAPGEPGKLPFWHGDAPGRPVEVGRAVGAFLRETAEASQEEARARLAADYALDELAAANLVAYVAEQRAAVGTVPSDRTIVVERFRDEIGDWRVCVLSPFGGRVHAPWALAIEARARERLGLDLATMATDDGIVIRLPDTDADGGAAGLAGTVVIDADDVEDLVVGELANSALFAARFRECAGRALLLPRRRGGSGGVARTPLWQQRQRAHDLLAVASRYGSFPVLLETYRECLRDVFDVPALVALLRDVAARRVRVVEVTTPQASPFASSLLFGYMAGYLYEGDAPLAERRAHALSLDRERLAELLGSGELRELVDPRALAELELVLQRLAPDRHARDPDGVHDLLREVGDLATHEVAARTDGPAERWLDELAAQRRAYPLRVAGDERWAAAEDAARFRDGLGIPPPAGLPQAFVAPVDRPLVDLVARYARTHGPFRPRDVAARLGLPPDAADLACKELERDGRLVAGEFRPGGSGPEWCDAAVLRRLRRASLAALRREVEAVEPAALGRFLPAWQGVGAGRSSTGADRMLEVVAQLQGAPIPASVLERDVLACRARDYEPAWLDGLAAAGQVVWVGRGPLGSRDGRVSLYLRDEARPLVAPPDAVLPGGGEDGSTAAQAAIPGWSARHAGIIELLGSRGASFWPAIHAAAGGGGEQEVLDALWDLVWAGLVTNDMLAPLRALVDAGARRARGAGRRRPGRAVTRSGPPAAAGRWSLVADLTQDGASATDRAAALAACLLDRHGVVVRDAVAAEDVPGGFGAVYGVLKAMEEAGRARRGYFVEGLGGAQFALPGAVDRLRGVREAGLDAQADAPTVLAATDPANPYGAALAWPEPLGAHGHAPRRVAGAHVVLVEGRPVVYVEKGGRSLLTFTADGGHLAAAAEGLGALVDAGRVDQLRVRRIDGGPPGSQPLAAHLRKAGFGDHPQGLVRRHR